MVALIWAELSENAAKIEKKGPKIQKNVIFGPWTGSECQFDPGNGSGVKKYNRKHP